MSMAGHYGHVPVADTLNLCLQFSAERYVPSSHATSIGRHRHFMSRPDGPVSSLLPFAPSKIRQVWTGP